MVIEVVEEIPVMAKEVIVGTFLIQVHNLRTSHKASIPSIPQISFLKELIGLYVRFVVKQVTWPWIVTIEWTMHIRESTLQPNL